MVGVFETLSIPKLEGEFYLHCIPFASLFNNYIPYDKALMLFTESYNFEQPCAMTEITPGHFVLGETEGRYDK